MTWYEMLQPRYRSGTNNVVNEFYRPCLAEAHRYDRAVGYFSSSALSVAARGLQPFLSKPEARIRLVASPAISEDDADAIQRGLDLQDFVTANLVRNLDEILPDPSRRRLEMLTWLIAHGRLELQLAVVRRGSALGIYHEKFGIFATASEVVAFSGSANESGSALIANFESIDVFRSWIPGEADRVATRVEDFENLWSNLTPGLEVLTFPEACRRELLDRYPPTDDPERLAKMCDADDDRGVQPSRPSAGTKERTQSSRPREHTMVRPPELELREYQKEAIRAWFDANGRGIWEMATGTGKTLTALALVEQLWKHLSTRHSLLVVVTVPYQHLAEQWATEARRFGIDPIICHGERPNWRQQLEMAVAASKASQGRLTLAVSVNDTFVGDTFQHRLRNASCQVLLIADEAHTMGARTRREALPEGVRYRLALSATPDRHLDPEGTEALRSYFGESIFIFSLRQAITSGALVPYKYFPVVVELTESENEEYIDLTMKISQFMTSDGPDPEKLPDVAKQLLFKRSRLVGSAQGKVARLRTVLEPYRSDTHTLIYCADRTGSPSQLDQVLDLAGNHLRMRAHTFTSEEAMQERRELLDRFGRGDLQALVAMKCLDEGVDMPATRRAFILASSQNPRQFIQRRGRVLRRAPGKDSAEIYDFIVSPPEISEKTSMWELERRLVARELSRVAEMAGAAANNLEAMAQLLELRRRYELLHIFPDIV